MRMRASRILGLALVISVAGFLATTPGHANCAAPVGVYLGFSGNGYVGSCGDVPYFYWWGHQAGVQNVMNPNGTVAGVFGNDSGYMSTLADNWIIPEGSGIPQSYQWYQDFNNYGGDGCPLLKTEADISCANGSTPTPPAVDMVVAGYDLANPLVGKAVVLSVDFSEGNGAYIFDLANAESVVGESCADAFNYTGPYPCGELPVPMVTSTAGCDAAGCTLNVTVGSHSVGFYDDCAVANSAPLNCPRNLYVGRQLFVKRAACDATSPANVGTFDTRTYIMTWDPYAGTGTVTSNFVPYAPQDLNLNGIQDGTELAHVPVILTDNAAQTIPVFIPKIADGGCAYLGVGLRIDQFPSATACGGVCKQVVTPLVSANGIPISLDSATPAADRVINLAASKATGKAIVSWDTTAELTTAGFNLIGVKKSGGQVQLNSALIPALKGTTGESASYSINLGARDLKGSIAVYVELVKISGAKELFGPASF